MTISITDKNETELLGIGICKVFIGFKEVLKRQKELEKEIKYDENTNSNIFIFYLYIYYLAILNFLKKQLSVGKKMDNLLLN